MILAAAVAEFNPFHNGHKYFLSEVRRLGATHIVAVMSGDTVQRGSAAVFDKYSRARTAVLNGADLVLELPCPYSCSNAEVFADSAVQIIAGLGIADRLCFGCETDDIQAIMLAARASRELGDSRLVREYLSHGESYPAAVCKAAEKLYGESVSEVLSSPNGVLAAEYCKALSKHSPSITPQPIPRKSAGHNSTEISQGITSASNIRSMIGRGEDISALVPQDFVKGQAAFDGRMEKALLFRLSCAEKSDLLSLPDMTDNLADRIISAVTQNPKTLNELITLCKNKSVTQARLRRAFLHLMLGVRAEDIFPVPYARILAFNERGTEILKAADKSFPVDTSLKRLEQSSPQAGRISRLEQNAAYYRYFCTQREENFVSEYSRKIVKA